MKAKATLGISAAALTLAIAVLVPFFLFTGLPKLFGRMGLEIDPVVRGGALERSIAEDGYKITVHHEVLPHLLQREQPFVQIDFSPAGALPKHVVQEIDVDGDGQADLRVSFDVPADAKTPMRGEIVSLSPRFRCVPNLAKRQFSELIVRVDDAILVRAPLTAK